MKYSEIKKIYNSCSSFYDFLFKSFFHPRQRAAIGSLSLKGGERILDVGVGTGLTLPIYPDNCQIVGVDLSVKMLEQAKKKVESLKMNNVSLLEMDACNLAFKDNSFDCVVATHIISVAPDPFRLIDEIRRVCKSHGKILIVNHFISSHPIIARVEQKCDPLCRKLGWRLDMSLEDLVKGTGLDVYKTYKLTKVDLWRIVHANNNKSQLDKSLSTNLSTVG